MQCEQFSALLDDLRDNRLDAQTEAAMRAHLHNCPRCQALLQMTEDLARLDADAPVPNDFRTQWQSRIRESGRRRIQALKSTLSVAAVLLFVIGGTALRRHSVPEPEHVPNMAMMRMVPTPATGGEADALASQISADAAPITQMLSKLADQAGAYLSDAWPFVATAAVAVLGYCLFKHFKKHQKG